jgi:hypothetical protein
MRFVIFAAPRTGSSHLVNTLSGHPAIFCHGNIFAQRMMPVFWPKAERPPAPEAQAKKTALRELRDADPNGFLEKVFQMDHGREHVGFKIFEGQNDSMLEKLAREPSVRKVVLFRKNVLANFASAIAAAKSGTWGAEKGEDQPGEIQKIRFDRKKFAKFHKKYIGFYQRVLEHLNDAGEPFHLINYDEINDLLFLRGLVRFIGADPRQEILEDTQRKQQVKLNPGDIMSRFSNPEDAGAFLTENNLLHWQHEGLTSFQDFH